jgi:hypothetical protein
VLLNTTDGMRVCDFRLCDLPRLQIDRQRIFADPLPERASLPEGRPENYQYTYLMLACSAE